MLTSMKKHFSLVLYQLPLMALALLATACSGDDPESAIVDPPSTHRLDLSAAYGILEVDTTEIRNMLFSSLGIGKKDLTALKAYGLPSSSWYTLFTNTSYLMLKEDGDSIGTKYVGGWYDNKIRYEFHTLTPGVAFTYSFFFPKLKEDGTVEDAEYGRSFGFIAKEVKKEDVEFEYTNVTATRRGHTSGYSTGNYTIVWSYYINIKNYDIRDKENTPSCKIFYSTDRKAIEDENIIGYFTDYSKYKDVVKYEELRMFDPQKEANYISWEGDASTILFGYDNSDKMYYRYGINIGFSHRKDNLWLKLGDIHSIDKSGTIE